MCVQYIGGYSVHWEDTMSTSGGYHEYIGGYLEYIGRCSVHQGDIMIHVGGYREYIGGGGGGEGCSVHRRDTTSTSGDIMIHVGEQIDKSL